MPSTITNVQVFPVTESVGKLRAFARVLLNNELQLTGLRIYEGVNGLFVAYPNDPSYQGEDYRQLFFPVTRELRDQIENACIDKYNELLAEIQPVEETTESPTIPEENTEWKYFILTGHKKVPFATKRNFGSLLEVSNYAITKGIISGEATSWIAFPCEKDEYFQVKYGAIAVLDNPTTYEIKPIDGSPVIKVKSKFKFDDESALFQYAKKLGKISENDPECSYLLPCLPD